jgi:hypothetical protein
MGVVVSLVAVVVMAMLIMRVHRALRRATMLPLSPVGAPELVPPKPTLLTDCITDDYGLLATAAVARTHADALLIKEHLRTAGIRATLANAPDGQIRVLVFGDEVVRARRLVS